VVQFSLPINKAGKASVLYNFILVFFGLNTLFIMLFFQIVICYQWPFHSHNISNLKECTCSMILLYITILLLIESCPLNVIDFVCCTDIVKPYSVITDLVYAQLSAGYLLCWIL
jgi:hypothetical protein